MQLAVTDDNGFLLYQSGYVVDKPHPNTGEMTPDGNLDDEDFEHLHAVVDPGMHKPHTRPALGPMAATMWWLKRARMTGRTRACSWERRKGWSFSGTN